MTSIGVIGVGRLGSLHAKMLATISEIRLAGVFDADPAKASTLAGELRTEVFPSIEGLLERCDAVTIATPTSTHHDIGLQALAAGMEATKVRELTGVASERVSRISTKLPKRPNGG